MSTIQFTEGGGGGSTNPATINLADVIANRPAASSVDEGTMFLATDTNTMYRSDGSASWVATSTGAAASSLSGLSDTDVTGVADDNFLLYDTTGSEWTDRTAAQVRTVLNVEDGATADQTGAQIKTAYEAEADTNAFTDAEQTKLSGIETAADVTDETNVKAALDGATTTEVTPASTDKILMLDASDADNLKHFTWSDITGEVTTHNSVTTAHGISAFGATLVDDADAATARTTLGVDAAGTDNSTDVTLAGTPDYITISGQVITRGLIVLSTDVTGALPVANGGTGSTTASGARTALGVDAAGTDNAPAASTSVAGKVELATTAETDTGTATALAVTPDGLAGSNYGTKSVCIVPFESGDAVATGNGTIAFTVPESMNEMDLVDATASHHTAGSGAGTTDIMVRRRRGTTDADMLSTAITTDAQTSASDGVINTSNDDVNTGDQIYIDVDAIEATPPNGLSVVLSFRVA